MVRLTSHVFWTLSSLNCDLVALDGETAQDSTLSLRLYRSRPEALPRDWPWQPCVLKVAFDRAKGAFRCAVPQVSHCPRGR
jgi:hypothetical protein